MSVVLAEFIGTLLLILLGNGVVANVLLTKSKGQSSGWIVICVGWGIAVVIPVYLVGWWSGAHLNPAVTFGMALLGLSKWSDMPFYLMGQFLGAFAGAVLVWLAYLPHWKLTEDQNLKLMTFCTKPAVYKPFANLLTEIIATAALLIGIMAIIGGKQAVDPSLQPYLIGLLVIGLGLSLGGETGFAINPARDLAPRIAHAILPIAQKGSSDWAYAWIPVVGPMIGSALGIGIYQLFFNP